MTKATSITLAAVALAIIGLLLYSARVERMNEEHCAARGGTWQKQSDSSYRCLKPDGQPAG